MNISFTSEYETIVVDVTPTSTTDDVIETVCNEMELSKDVITIEPKLVIEELQDGDTFCVILSQRVISRNQLIQMKLNPDDYNSLFNSTEDGVVELFIDCGMPPDTKIGNSLNLLFVSSSKGNLSDCKLLLKKYSADPNLFIRDSPLIASVQGGFLSIAAVLLEAGAHPNYRDSYGRTALMYSTSSDMVRLLLECGADIEVRDLLQKPASEHLRQAGLLPVL